VTEAGELRAVVWAIMQAGQLWLGKCFRMLRAAGDAVFPEHGITSSSQHSEAFWNTAAD
jgi:hypothetical protein